METRECPTPEENNGFESRKLTDFFYLCTKVFLSARMRKLLDEHNKVIRKDFASMQAKEDFLNPLNSVSLTPDKQSILQQIQTFIHDSEKQVFILKGAAGSGKETDSDDESKKSFHYYFPLHVRAESQIVIVDEASMVSDVVTQHELTIKYNNYERFREIKP